MEIQQIAAIVVVFAVIALMWLRIKRKGGCCGGAGQPADTTKK